MDIFKINGRAYKVRVLQISESFEVIQGENYGETIAPGRQTVLDPKGTKYSHSVTVARDKMNPKEFDLLYMEISRPRFDGIEVEIVHNQKTIKYMAEVQSGGREVRRINPKTGAVEWDSLRIDFKAMKAQVLPT